MSKSHVKEKTRSKILKGEYFDIAKLLSTLVDSDDEGKKSDSNTNIIKGFNDWIRCFHTLMSIRLEFAPNELQGMLMHYEIVQDLLEQGRDGILYDAKFRRRREQHPSISWGEYLPDLVLGLPINSTTSASTSAYRSRPMFNNPWQNFQNVAYPPRTRGPCFKYNRITGCQDTQCQWSHKCLL